jgi:hypothetical protein
MQRTGGSGKFINSYHEVAHELDGDVDVRLFQLLSVYGTNVRDVRHVCYVLEGRSLEG